MIVSTSYNPAPELKERAKRLASETGAKWTERQRHSIAKLKQLDKEGVVLLVTEQDLLLYANEQPLSFHPSTAQLRIKRLLQDEPDLLLQISGVERGDHVLDCTAGLGSDSIVFSYAVGGEGQVTALESEPLLYFIVKEGLLRYLSEVPAVNEAMRRIHVKNADHADYLREMSDDSVDVVYFDPMFRRPIYESSSMSPLRVVANVRPLENETVRQAVRVARKKVVLKENRFSDEFERLGFTRLTRSHSKFAYGVIDT